MTQAGGTHGPRKDDALKRETRSEVQANRRIRVEEWREPEPPGDDQPDATWAPVGRPGSGEVSPDPDTVELRSDLARHLDRCTFPADRAGLAAALEDHAASDQLLGLVAALPGDVTFGSLHDVLEALGLPIETRGG